MALFNIPKVGPPAPVGTFRRGKIGFPRQEEPIPITPPFPTGTEQGLLGDLGTGFQVGVTQIGEMGGQFFRGIGSGFLRSMGAKKLADDWDLRSYNESIKTGLSIHDLERDVDIPTRMDDIDSVGGGFQWGMYTVAKQAPQLVGQFGLSLIAGAVGGPGAAGATFWTTSYILGAGEVYSQALAETGESHMGAALVAGVPIAWMERLPYAGVFKRMGKGADYGSYVGKKISSGKYKNLWVQSLQTSAAEGTTEAAQNIIEQITVDYVQDRDIDISEIIRDPEFRESAGAGGVVGLVVGGPLNRLFGGRDVRGVEPLDIAGQIAAQDLILKEQRARYEAPPPTDVGAEAEEALGLTTLHGEPLPAYKLTFAQRTQREAEALVGPEVAVKRTLRQYEPVDSEGAPIATDRRPGFAQEEEGPMPVWLQRQRLLPITRPKGEKVEPRRRGTAVMPEAPVLGGAEMIDPAGIIAPTVLTAVDEDYLEQAALVDRLNKDLRKSSMEGPDAENAARDQLDIERLKLDVMALESAVQDMREGGEGVTVDGQTIPQIQESIRRARPRQVFAGLDENYRERMQPADFGLAQLHEQVKATVLAGPKGEFAKEAKTLIGLYTEGTKQKRELRREERKQAEKEQTEREEEARLTPLKAQVAGALQGFDLESAGVRGRLGEVLKAIGINAKNDLKLEKGFNAKTDDLVQAAYNFAGIEREEAVEIEEVTETDVAEVDAKKEADDYAQRAAEKIVQDEENTAELIRDTMETETGEWRTAEEIGMKDFSQLLREVGARIGETGLTEQEAMKELRRIEGKRPITARELERLSRADEGQFAPIVAAMRRNIEGEWWRDTAVRELLAEYEIDAEGIIHGPRGVVEEEVIQKILGRILRRFDHAERLLKGERTRPFQTEKREKVKGFPEDQTPFKFFQQWGLPFLEHGEEREQAATIGKGTVFISTQWLTDPHPDVAPPVFPEAVPEEGSQLWYKDYWREKGEESINREVGQIVNYINGESEGTTVGGFRFQAFGLKKLNYDIQRRNSSRKKDNQLDLFTLVDTSSDEVLEWDAQQRTSKELVADIKKELERAYKEPEWSLNLKDKIQKRLAKRDGVAEGDTQEWKDLRPVAVSESGRYVLKPKEVIVREETEERAPPRGRQKLGRLLTKESGIVVRKTKTQKGLMQAYNEKDELIGVQEFDEELTKMIMADLDHLRVKYDITPGSKSDQRNWSRVPKEELVKIFLKYNIPLQGFLRYTDLKGKTQEVPMSQLGASVAELMGEVQTDGTSSLIAQPVLRDVPDHAIKFDEKLRRTEKGALGYGRPPQLERVWVGEKESIPESIRDFLSYKKELGGWVFKRPTRDRVGMFPKKGMEQEFAEAFSQLSTEEQNKFKDGWTHQSPEIKVMLRSQGGRWATDRLSFTQDDKERFWKNPSAFLGGKRLKGRITGYIPAVFRYDPTVDPLTHDRALWSPMKHLLGQDAFVGEVRKGDVEGWVRTEKERIEFTDDTGEIHYFTKDDIYTLDTESSDIIDPYNTPLTQGDLANALEANIIHGREDESSFLQRMSDPELQVQDGISYYIQPKTIEVGTAVIIKAQIKPGIIQTGPLKPGQTYRAPYRTTARKVERIDDEGYFFLEDRPRYGYTADELEAVHFPVVRGMTSYLDEDGTLVVNSPERTRTAEEVWEINRMREVHEKALAPFATKEPRKRTIGDSLTARDVAVGHYVRLRKDVLREKRDLHGKRTFVVAEYNEKPRLEILKEGFMPKGQEHVFEISKGGVMVELRDVITDEVVIRTHVSNISPKSPNSNSVMEAVRKIKAGPTGNVIPDTVENWTMIPQEIAPTPDKVDYVTTRKQVVEYNEETGRYEVEPWEQQRVVTPAEERPTEAYFGPLETNPVRAGLHEAFILGRVLKIERQDEEGSPDRGEWKIYEFTEDTEEFQHPETGGWLPGKFHIAMESERGWEWHDTVRTLKDAREEIERHFGLSEGLLPEGVTKEQLSDQLNVAPVRRWQNEYGITIEEFLIDNVAYYEAYLPATYNQLGVVERFGPRADEEGSSAALQRALDKYGGGAFYDNKPVGVWLKDEASKAAIEGGRQWPTQAAEGRVWGILPGTDQLIFMRRGLTRHEFNMQTEREWVAAKEQSAKEKDMYKTDWSISKEESDEFYRNVNDRVPVSTGQAVNNWVGREPDLANPALSDEEQQRLDAYTIRQQRLADRGEITIVDLERDDTLDNDPSLDPNNINDEETKLHSLYTEGGFPQYYTASRAVKGTTSQRLFNKLMTTFGPGIFNVVNIYDTQGDLPPNLNSDQRLRAVAFNHKVSLVAENIEEGKIIPIMMHEIGAHGFRAVMGTKAYMSLLGEIAKLAISDAGVRKAYLTARATVRKTHPEANEWLVLEETMAYYAEENTPSDNTFWRTLLHYVAQGLHRLKIMFTSELKGWQVMVLVRSSFNSHINTINGADGRKNVYTANFLDMPLYQTDDEWGPPLSDPDETAARNILGDGNDVMPEAARDFVEPRSGLGSLFKMVWGPKSWKKESQLSIRGLGRKRGGQRFRIEPGTQLYRAIVHYFGTIKDYESFLEATKGGKISRKPSEAEGDYQNQTVALRNRFKENFINPMIEFAKKHDIEMDDFGNYLYAMHAPSVNNEKPGWRKKTNIPPPAGIFTTEAEKLARPNILVGRPSAEQVMKELREKYGVNGMSNLEQAAKYVYNALDHRLNILRDEGLVPEWQIKQWLGQRYYNPTIKKGKVIGWVEAKPKRQLYASTYVPLRGDNDERTWAFFGDDPRASGFGIRGVEEKRRMGRRSPAESPWAWAFHKVNTTIDRAAKNKVDQAFARMVTENKELLGDYMMIISAEDKKFFQGRDPETSDLFLDLALPQQSDPQHVISFKQNGEQWHILVKDKNIGRALNKTHYRVPGNTTRWVGMINRIFGMMHTAWSPPFIVTNFARDYQFAIMNIIATAEIRKGIEKEQAKEIALGATKNLKKSIAGMYRYIRTGKSDTEGSAAAKEFTDNGGRIDFYAFKNAKDLENKIGDIVKKGDRKGYLDGLWFMRDLVSDINGSVENAMRLATYIEIKRVAMSNGLTETEAIQLGVDAARNLTVNFTMKGELTPIFNAWYLFFNAGTAGGATFLRAFNKSRRLRKFLKGIMVAQMTLSVYNYLFSGEDEEGKNRYAQIDMGQRSRQMFIWVPGANNFAKIPLGYGSNIPNVVADTFVSMAMGQINPWEATTHLISSITESFSPLDIAHSDSVINTLFKSASPTIGDPLVDIALNENWAGNPIYKVPFAGRATEPPAYRSWSSTSAPSKHIADWLNRLSAGMYTWFPGGEKARLGSKYEQGFISIDPPILDYMFKTATGGVGNFLGRATSFLSPWRMQASGQFLPRQKVTGEIQWNKVPVIRRFWDTPHLRDKWDANTEFTAFSEEVGAAKLFAEGVYRDFGPKSEEWRSFKRSKHYSVATLIPLLRKINGEITKLYKIKARFRRSKLLTPRKDEMMRKVDLRILRLKKKFNRIFREKTDRNIRFPFRKAA